MSRGDRAAAFCCLAAAAACAALPVSNPDLWWHLSAGRFIAETLSVPRADWLSFTRAGAPWTDFEWGVQLLWYGLWRLWGLAGLWALKSLLLGACAALAWATLGLYGLGAPARALGVLAWSLAALGGNDARPENFSLLFFWGLWFLLERARLAGEGGGGPSEGARGAWLVPPILFVLWANAHGGFVYGLALFAFHAPGRGKGAPRLLGLGALCAAATLANPYGLGVWSVILRHAEDLGTLGRHVWEWGATPAGVWQAPFWALAAAAAAGLALRRRGEGSVPRAHALACAFLGLAASRHARFGPYFAGAAVCAAAEGFARAARAGAISFGLARFGKALSGAALLLFFLLKVAPRLGRAAKPEDMPSGAAAFLERERDVFAGKRMLHPWQWGGYLGFRLGFPVFVDGRYLFHDLLEPMGEAANSPEAYRAFLDGHRFAFVVWRRSRQVIEMPARLKDGSVRKLRRPAVFSFLPKDAWALVYWDALSAVFARRANFPAAWTRSREYAIVRPGDAEAAALLVAEGLASEPRAHEEFLRLTREAPGEAAAYEPPPEAP